MNTIDEGEFESELKKRIWEKIEAHFLDQIYLPSDQNAGSGIDSIFSEGSFLNGNSKNFQLPNSTHLLIFDSEISQMLNYPDCR